MPSTNGHGLKRAILYARVSTEEQARRGYSLAQQFEALREYAAREGYEIQLERGGLRGDPDREAKAWLEKLAETGRKRSGFQDMAAEGLITFDELRAKLADLDETRATARRELEVLERRREHLERLERDKETLLENYAALAQEALDSLAPEERHHLYKMLKLRVDINLDESLEVGGMLVDPPLVCNMEG